MAGPGNCRVTRTWGMRPRRFMLRGSPAAFCEMVRLTCHCCVRLWRDPWTPWRLVPGRSGWRGLARSCCWGPCPGKSEGSAHQSWGRRAAVSWTFSCQTSPSDLKHMRVFEFSWIGNKRGGWWWHVHHLKPGLLLLCQELCVLCLLCIHSCLGWL